MAAIINQVFEIKEVDSKHCEGWRYEKRGPQDEGITLWFTENKGDKKMI